jgi:hypothetical protein
MKDIITQILNKLCYTQLVYGRINKKLCCKLSESEIERLIFDTISNTPEEYFEQTGKNVYVTNPEKNIKITINRNTFRVITVDRLNK